MLFSYFQSITYFIETSIAWVFFLSSFRSFAQPLAFSFNSNQFQCIHVKITFHERKCLKPLTWEYFHRSVKFNSLMCVCVRANVFFISYSRCFCIFLVGECFQSSASSSSSSSSTHIQSVGKCKCMNEILLIAAFMCMNWNWHRMKNWIYTREKWDAKVKCKCVVTNEWAGTLEFERTDSLSLTLTLSKSHLTNHRQWEVGARTV